MNGIIAVQSAKKFDFRARNGLLVSNDRGTFEDCPRQFLLAYGIEYGGNALFIRGILAALYD